MPARRMLTMRHLRRIMRLHHEGASARGIVRAVGVERSTVQDALKRAAAAQLSWPLPDDLTDEVLEARLFARSGGGATFGVRKCCATISLSASASIRMSGDGVCSGDGRA